MNAAGLAGAYRAYIDCLNRQAWDELGHHVHDDVSRNGETLKLSGHRAMLQQSFRQCPDLRFNLALLVCEPPHVAARLAFDCRPIGEFLDLPVNGRRVTFVENVFYTFEDGKIGTVWSVIDKEAVERSMRS